MTITGWGVHLTKTSTVQSGLIVALAADILHKMSSAVCCCSSRLKWAHIPAFQACGLGPVNEASGLCRYLISQPLYLAISARCVIGMSQQESTDGRTTTLHGLPDTTSQTQPAHHMQLTSRPRSISAIEAAFHPECHEILPEGHDQKEAGPDRNWGDRAITVCT